MFKLLLLVGAGGCLGSICRYLVQQGFARLLAGSFPTGTLLVNVAGSFLIGIVYAWSEKNGLLSAEGRLFLATGFCGGFTTFSTFSYEMLLLLRQGAPGYALLYAATSVLAILLATAAGIYLTRFL